MVVACDVRLREEQHALLNEWAEMILAEFELIPRVDPTNAKRFPNKKRS